SQTLISILVLVALLASFCGLLKQFTRILLGSPRGQPTRETNSHAPASEFVTPTDCGRSMGGQSFSRSALDGVPAMVLLLGALLLFSVWMPVSIFQLLNEAAKIVGGKT